MARGCRPFSGTADEVATSTGTDAGATPVKGVLRTDAAHDVTRFDWGVQSCEVH